MPAWTSILALAAAPLLAETTTPVAKEFPVAGLEAVEVRVSAGVVAIGRSDTGVVRAEATPKRFSKACAITIETKGKRVLVHVREKRRRYYGLSWGQDSCEAEVTIRMPQHLRLDAATGSAAAAVSGMRAAITFQAGSGSLRFQECSGPIDARVGSGSIGAAGLRAPARARSGSGSIRLNFAEAPASGEIRATTGSGSIEIALPAGTKAVTAARSGSGRITNTLADDPKAPLRVVARSGSGDITLTESSVRAP